MKWPCGSLLIAAFALSACSGDGERHLSYIPKEGYGPDEFAIVPNKPLETPEDLSTLPPPTPGGPNRADQNPVADAVVALGGKPSTQTEIPGRDAAVVNYAARGGIQPGIGQVLAQEDYETRRRHGRRDIFHLGATDDYTAAYKSQWLDADRELARLRAHKIKTPSAPPPED